MLFIIVTSLVGLDLTPAGRHKEKRRIQQKEKVRMKKKGTKRRVYPEEFKAEAVAVAVKREKPISQIAFDLGINENMLRRWMQRTQEQADKGVRVFPGHGRPRDAELSLLRKEVRALREANEI